MPLEIVRNDEKVDHFVGTEPCDWEDDAVYHILECTYKKCAGGHNTLHYRALHIEFRLDMAAPSNTQSNAFLMTLFIGRHKF